MKQGGANEADCIKVGHDLEKAINAAEARGYSSCADLREIARQLGPSYQTHALRDLARDGYEFDQSVMQRTIADHLSNVRIWIIDARIAR
jgi:hypothetical protein